MLAKNITKQVMYGEYNCYSVDQKKVTTMSKWVSKGLYNKFIVEISFKKRISFEH